MAVRSTWLNCCAETPASAIRCRSGTIRVSGFAAAMLLVMSRAPGMPVSVVLDARGRSSWSTRGSSPVMSTWTGCEPPPPPPEVETRIVATGMSLVIAMISSAIWRCSSGGGREGPRARPGPGRSGRRCRRPRSRCRRPGLRPPGSTGSPGSCASRAVDDLQHALGRFQRRARRHLDGHGDLAVVRLRDELELDQAERDHRDRRRPAS